VDSGIIDSLHDGIAAELADDATSSWDNTPQHHGRGQRHYAVAWQVHQYIGMQAVRQSNDAMRSLAAWASCSWISCGATAPGQKLLTGSASNVRFYRMSAQQPMLWLSSGGCSVVLTHFMVGSCRTTVECTVFRLAVLDPAGWTCSRLAAAIAKPSSHVLTCQGGLSDCLWLGAALSRG
jgi:hypothetical protein